ncbi:MAG: hypothetical protein V1743_06720, partial [Nanoarchaeota archaeon]
EKFYAEFQAFYDKERFERTKNPFLRFGREKKELLHKYNNFEKLFEGLEQSKYGNNMWIEAFKRLYGENAVLASHDTNVNQDATIMGYKPIKLNSNIQLYLKDNGLQDADSLGKDREYRWNNRKDLTDQERSIFNLADELTMAVFGQRNPLEIRVYTGLYTKSGREIETSQGVYIKEEGGRKYIGIKRSALSNPEQFATSFLHEIGHAITNKSDYDREFADGFINAAARLALELIKLRKQSH